MTTIVAVEQRETLSAIWSSKKQRAVCVRISFLKHKEDDCKIYTIEKVEELN